MTKNSIIEKVSAQHYQFQNNLKLYQYLLLKILYAHTDRFLPSTESRLSVEIIKTPALSCLYLRYFSLYRWYPTYS